MRVGFEGGLATFARLDRRDLFLWLGKIYYGLVYKESLQPISDGAIAAVHLFSEDGAAEDVFWGTD